MVQRKTKRAPAWMHGITTLTLAGAAPVVISAQQSAAAAPSLVFDGVTVVDVEQGKLVPDQRVVITGNRIAAVGSTSAVKEPKERQVVDARGKYLIPGLWDMHTHSRYLAHLFYPLFIANGVTGIRDAWSDTPLDTLIRWRQEILAGTRVGPPRQLLAGKALATTDSAEAAHEVDSLKAAGANFIKTYPFNFALAAAARHAGVPFGGHVDSIGAMDVSDSGASIVDHPNSAGGLDVLCLGSEATSEQCQPLAERFQRNGTWWVPTFIRAINEGLTGDGIGQGSEAVFERFSERVQEFWSDSAQKAGAAGRTGVGSADASLAPTPPSTAPSFDSLGVMRLAQRVGLPILAGTDAGAPVIKQMPPGLSLHAELAMYVAEGLTPLHALQTATLNPAKLLHGTDSLGTVAAGKLADLVLLDANPLADITNTMTIRAVVANGRYFDRAALDQLLVEVRTRAQSIP